MFRKLKMTSYLLPAGTILYHGTDLLYETIHNEPSFFVLSEAEALEWAGWSNEDSLIKRVLIFEVVEPIELLHIPDEEAEHQLVEYLGVEDLTGDIRASLVCERLDYAGYIWGAPSQPSEIVLCRPQEYLRFIGARLY